MTITATTESITVRRTPRPSDELDDEFAVNNIMYIKGCVLSYNNIDHLFI